MECNAHLTRSPTIRCESRAPLPWSSGFTAMLPTKETARRSTKASSGLPSVTHMLSLLSWSSTASAPPVRQTHGTGLPCPVHRSVKGLLPQTSRPTPTQSTLPLSGVSPETLTRFAPTGQGPVEEQPRDAHSCCHLADGEAPGDHPGSLRGSCVRQTHLVEVSWLKGM